MLIGNLRVYRGAANLAIFGRANDFWFVFSHGVRAGIRANHGFAGRFARVLEAPTECRDLDDTDGNISSGSNHSRVATHLVGQGQQYSVRLVFDRRAFAPLGCIIRRRKAPAPLR